MKMLSSCIAAYLVVAFSLVPHAYAVPAEKSQPHHDHTPTPTKAGSKTATVPKSCTTTSLDRVHSTAWTGTHLCHTHTRTIANALCPPLTCAPPPTDLVCPQYIKVSSTTVPCATDCCPTTGTTTVEAGTGSRTGAGSDNCPTCDPCRIPTEWITYTTGCPGGGVRVSTSYSTPTGPS